jgi:hypothetical protein
MRKAWGKFIVALAEFDYLTAGQLTRLLYAASSLKHVQEQLKLLVDAGYVLTLGGRTVNLPLIYALAAPAGNTLFCLAHYPKHAFVRQKRQTKAATPIFSSILLRSQTS